MNQTSSDPTLSIADQANFESWQNTRSETRRQLASTLSVGLFYLLAALAVGAYLLLAFDELLETADLGEGIFYYANWEEHRFNLPWIPLLAWGYGAAGLIAVAGYVLAILAIFDRCPASLYSFIAKIPLFGSTLRALSLGDFCQSIYQSVAQRCTYDDAMSRAANVIRNAGMRQWSHQSSLRLQSGQSVDSILKSSPIRDQPLAAVSVMAAKPMTDTQTAAIWCRAAEECHLLAQSRLERTKIVISTTCMIASVSIASLAMLTTVRILRIILRGMFYWY
ncbi:MAG: hypothetical protein KDB00_08930 [Planctomycetales bacterium]|nr:hypothetical protein [Planctomycetales bacterium]